MIPSIYFFAHVAGSWAVGAVFGQGVGAWEEDQVPTGHREPVKRGSSALPDHLPYSPCLFLPSIQTSPFCFLSLIFEFHQEEEPA